jgi:hypothetical protein
MYPVLPQTHLFAGLFPELPPGWRRLSYQTYVHRGGQRIDWSVTDIDLSASPPRYQLACPSDLVLRFSEVPS